MSDKIPPPAPDYAALAQRYLELWQDQVAKLAKEPPRDMSDLTAMTQAWSKMAASMTPGTPGAAGHDAGAHGASAAPSSYGHGGVDRAGGPGGADAQLATRLTAIEQRLAAIESQLASLAPAPKPSKPRAAGGGRGAGKKP